MWQHRRFMRAPVESHARLVVACLISVTTEPAGAQRSLFYEPLFRTARVEDPCYVRVWRPRETPPIGAPTPTADGSTGDYGWVWVSEEPYGWVVYHYGA